MAEVDTPASSSLPEGMILPPPSIKAIADKTAAAVAKSPKPLVFEESIRARGKSDSRFAFLNQTDAYHPYYQHKLAAFRAGEAPAAKADASAGGAAAGGAGGVDGLIGEGAEEGDGRPKEPAALEFLVDSPPAIHPVDLDILRLTALFAARSGRKFTSELANRESRNYQFDFLRPSHSLFGYFNKLTEQYTKVLIPSQETLTRLDRRAGLAAGDSADPLAEGRREVLKDAKERAEWDKFEHSRQKELEDQAEADRIAFAEIDWQDFVVVSTIEFTEQEEAGAVELPPPMSLSEVENMTIAQKKMAAMIMEGKEEEAQLIGRDGEGEGSDEGEAMEEDSEDEAEQEDQAKFEAERQRVAMDANAPMKIRKDYIPKSKRTVAPTTNMTTFGNQQVPVEELSKHIQIELLDPRYKEQKRVAESNRSASNLLPGGTDVSQSIRQLAMHRPDIFGTPGAAEEEAKRQQELLAKSKAREKNVWDGHTASREAIQARYQAGADLSDQIEALHRAKGLVGPEDGQAPKIGPAIPEPVEPTPEEAEEPAPAPPPSSFLPGATISGAPQLPQPPAPYGQPPFGQPQYANFGQGYQSFGPPPTGFPPAEGVPPAPPADGAAGEDGPPLPTTLPAGLPARPVGGVEGEAGAAAEAAVGETRPAEDQPEDERATKKQRTEELVPEAQWINRHPNPIVVKVELPDYPDKPAWGCNGETIELNDIPLTLFVSTLRDRITAKIGIPISKQKLTLNGKPLANTASLAKLNFEDGETISLSVKDAKKK